MNDGPMTKDAHRWGPLTGVLFVALAVAIFAVAGDAPDDERDDPDHDEPDAG